MLTGIVLCAGFSTRSGGIVKPLVKIHNLPLLHWSLKWLKLITEKIIVVTNSRDYDQYETFLNSVELDICLINDRKKSPEERLGTVGSTIFTVQYVCKKLGVSINSDFVVIAGDNLLDFSAHNFIHFCNNYDFDLIVASTADRVLLDNAAGRYGIINMDHNCAVTNFEEKPVVIPKGSLVASGTIFLKGQVLCWLEKFAEECKRKNKIPDAFGEFIAWAVGKIRIGSYLMEGNFFDIGHRDLSGNIERKFKPIGWTESYISPEQLAGSIQSNIKNPGNDNSYGKIYLSSFGNIFVKYTPKEVSMLQAEFDWSFRWHSQLPEIPAPLDFRLAKSGAYFLMEYIDKVAYEITDKLLRDLTLFIKKVHTLSCEGLLQNNAEVVFVKTFEDSIVELSSRFPKEVSELTENFLPDLKLKFGPELDDLGIGIVHGDPYFGNCFIDSSGSLKVVDPSGGLIARPFALDLGKLGQSIIGRIDELRRGTLLDNEDLTYFLNPKWEDYVKIVEKIYNNVVNNLDKRKFFRILFASTACCLVRSASRYDDIKMAHQLVKSALVCIRIMNQYIPK